jgi:NADH-quinone oxidoreductase subunit J
MERVIFYIFAILIVVMAIASVTSRKILRAVIYLLLSLISVSAIYFMLEYNFLGAIQLAVYAGGIIILFIFAVLLVHQIEEKLDEPSFGRKILMGGLSATGLGITLFTIWSHDFKIAAATKAFDVKDIGRGLLETGDGGFILPFEVISVLLLASMIGAIIIIKGGKTSEKS